MKSTMPKRHAAASAARIRVGTGGWTYAPWRGTFYPRDLVQRRELEYASRQLTSIEINGTYYRSQSPATYMQWREQTPDRFVFSLKAPRHATSRKRLAAAGGSIDAFVGDLGALGDRLGPILWQFDPSKTFDADDLAAFLALLPSKVDGIPLRHALEVRHASFMCPQYIELARRHGCATVFTDSRDYPSFCDVSAGFIYVRLMQAQSRIGTGYPTRKLAQWAARASAWHEGLEPDDLPRVLPPADSTRRRDVFVYFINGAKERAPRAATALIARIAASQ